MSSTVGLKQENWHDMSDHVVHITKEYNDKSSLENLLCILSEQNIEARSMFGLAKSKAPDPASQKAVCFTEIPLTELRRVAERRSGYGLVISKPIAVMRGANPIWYAYKDKTISSNIRHLVDCAIESGNKDDPIFKISPFIDVPGTYKGGPYLFEWEREWRHQGDFKFSTDDIEFLIMPEEDHENAKRIFSGLKKHPKLGHAYDAPLIDARWKRKKIREVLSGVL